jgi:hypothetical protein
MIPVYHWDANAVKANCLDYCGLYLAYQIKSNIGTGLGIIPLFYDQNATRDFAEHGLWVTIKLEH